MTSNDVLAIAIVSSAWLAEKLAQIISRSRAAARKAKPEGRGM